MNRISWKALAFLTLFSVTVAGCSPSAQTPTVQPTVAMAIPTVTSAPTLTPLPTSTPTSAPTVAPTPSVGGLVADAQHYNNPEYGIGFDYPAGWETYSYQDALSVNAIAAENMIIGVTRPGSDYMIRMAITVETGGPDSFSDDEYRQYARLLDEASPSAMASFQKISDNIITIGGVRALEYVFIYDPQLGTGLDQIRQIGVVWKGYAFTLSCGAPAGEFDAVNKEAFDLIVRSFRFD